MSNNKLTSKKANNNSKESSINRLEKELSLLSTIIEFSQENNTFTEVLQLYLEAVTSLFSASFALVYLRKKNTDSLFISEIRFAEDNQFPKDIETAIDQSSLLLSDSLVGVVLATKQYYLWTADDKEFSPIRAQFAKQYNLVGTVSIPISRFGDVIAVAEFALTSWEYANELMIKRACSAAAQIGITLERRKAQKQLQLNYKELLVANTQLQQAQQQLIQSEKMASLGLLSAGVAHEINNPIGYVKSNLGSLKEYTDILLELNSLHDHFLNVSSKESSTTITRQKSKIKAYKIDTQYKFLSTDVLDLIDDSQKGIERIIEIVDHLKTFAHAGGDSLRRDDVNTAIKNALNVFSHKNSPNIAVKIDLNNIPKIDCNIGQLSQVFINLLINAKQAIKEKGTINISSELQDGEIIISVSDDGEGITELNINQIFDPFFTSKPAGEGTGLGLSISYGIIQGYNGNIRVKSEVGIGTTFIISLPIAEPTNNT